MEIIINRKETELCNKNKKPAPQYKPVTLEIQLDDDDEFPIGLVVSADRRSLYDSDENEVRLQAWFTRKEFSEWIGQLVSRAAIVGSSGPDESR